MATSGPYWFWCCPKCRGVAHSETESELPAAIEAHMTTKHATPTKPRQLELKYALVERFRGEDPLIIALFRLKSDANRCRDNMTVIHGEGEYGFTVEPA